MGRTEASKSQSQTGDIDQDNAITTRDVIAILQHTVGLAGIEQCGTDLLSSPQWLHTEGNRIVDQEGNPVVLRGVNVENRNWVWPFPGGTDIAFERLAIAKVTGDPDVDDGWGANLVRLDIAAGPVNRFLDDDPANDTLSDELYVLALDEIVEIATNNRAYVLISYRFKEPDPGTEIREPDQAGLEPVYSGELSLSRLARRYKNSAAALYALHGEPHQAGKNSLGEHLETWLSWKPIFESMIRAIYAENPRALIAVPGTGLSRYVFHALEHPIEGTNLIYKSHPWNKWETIQSGDSFYFDFRLGEVAAIYPVILGSFGVGFFQRQGEITTVEDIRNLLNFAEQHGISWSAWLFHDKGCQGPGTCLLQYPWEEFDPTEYGQDIKRRTQQAAMDRGYSPRWP